ncbi:hypothetical protein CsSME_00052545 [Camellia sinensis var. sinensis]
MAFENTLPSSRTKSTNKKDKPKKAHNDFLHQISLLSSSANLPCPVFHHLFILSWSFSESLPSNPSHSRKRHF